jgi:hypothetical protein
MDFTQAYDRVKRTALWEHLTSTNMPAYLLSAIKGMYDGDTYILEDGGRRTPPIRPDMGVRQGCPLSPLLFALYINDYAPPSHPSGEPMGPPCRSNPERRFSFVFYADDLLLIAATALELSSMLTALRQYSRRKGLVVNASKSKTMVLNTRGSSNDRGEHRVREERGSGWVKFQYDNQPLGMVAEFKYLGLVFNAGASMPYMEERRARALMGGIREVRRIARMYGSSKCAWVVLQLFQTFALSHAMFGCQVWGSRAVRIDRVFDGDVAKRHMGFLRRVGGVQRSTAHWVVLSELGRERPLHFYWVRALLRFHKRCLSSNSPLMADAIKSDAMLATEGSTLCWSAELATGLASIGQAAGVPDVGAGWAESVKSATPVEVGEVVPYLEHVYAKLAWGGFEGVDNIRSAQLPQAADRRKHLTYFKWFKQEGWAAYLHSPPSRSRQVKQVARLRMGSHGLEVEWGRRQGVEWQDRHCTRCSQAHLSTLGCKVDDEYHLLFECENTTAVRSDAEYRPLLDRSWWGVGGDVRALVGSNCELAMGYITKCMDVADATRIAQQAAA